ncbi:MAG TPA: hypothetical protein VMJ10_01150 [Kofleriaceae bacterium]|nr:hypothetical protein [Kofleriaceae bacterium]
MGAPRTASVLLYGLLGVACNATTSSNGEDSVVHPDSECQCTGSASPPTIGAEEALDSPIVATIGANALDPVVAFDGTDYLVVWTDWRTDGAYSNVWATRIDQTGGALDPTSFPIGVSPGVQQHPAVAFDGSQFVVVWEDYKVPGGTDADIAAAAVAIDGTVTPLPAVAATSASETTPVLATTASGGVIAAWVANNQIVAGFVEGGPTGAIAVTSSAEPSSEPALGTAPTGEILVAYTQASVSDQADTLGQLLGPTGALTGGPIGISTGVSRTASPSISFDGTNFIVAFVDYATGVDIYATRVTRAGAVLDSHAEGGIAVGGALVVHATAQQQYPTISCDAVPGECLVTWQDTRNLPVPTSLDIYGVRMSSTTVAPIGSPFVVSNAPREQTMPRVVGTSGGYVAVWQDARAGGDGQLRAAGARITSSGSVQDVDGLVLDTGYNFQRYPAIASTSSHVFVAWNDSRSLSGDDIVFAQLDHTGAQLAPVDGLATAPYTQQDTAATVVGDNFLFAWRDDRDGIGAQIRISRVTQAGSNLDPDGIVISPAGSDTWVHPAVASSGNEVLVVWVHAPSSKVRELYASIVQADGSTGPSFPIATGPEQHEEPAIAWDPTACVYVVVWQAGATNTPTEIRAARVRTDGTVLDPGGVVLAATATGVASNPRIAFAGPVGLIAYQGYATDWNIYTLRVRADSPLLATDVDPIALTTDPATESAPDVTSLGDAFFVTWTSAQVVENGDVWGERVAAVGANTGTAFVIADSAYDEGSAVVTRLSATSVLVAYTLHRMDIDAKRVVTRVLEVPAPRCNVTDDR